MPGDMVVEVVMKDISMVRYDPQRLWELEDMAREGFVMGREMVGRVGIEPTTPAFSGPCSTPELPAQRG